MKNPSPATKRDQILEEMRSLGTLKRGKLTEQRRPSGKVYYHYQVWEKGRNRTEYIPAEAVPDLKQAIEQRQAFEALAEAFIDASSSPEREQSSSKKKPSHRSRRS